MSDSDDIRFNLETEKNKLKKMNSKQKLDYFKSYYLGPLIAVVLVIIGVLWFAYDAFISNKTPLYTGGAIGCYVSEEGENYLTEGFLGYLGGDPKRECVRFTPEMVLTYDEGDAYNSQSDDVAVYALLAAGEYNYLLIDGNAIDHYMKMEAFMDISAVAEKYEIPDEHCVRGEDGVIYSLRLPDAVTEKIGVNSSNGVYIGVVMVKKTGINNDAFIKYIFE